MKSKKNQKKPIRKTYPAFRSEARETGSFYYYTNLPCKWGHRAKRFMSNGHCTVCSRLRGGETDYHKKRRDLRHFMRRNTQRNARRKGLAFNLEKDDFIIPTHCPVLGLPLRLSEGKRIDNTPSVDRIDSKKGYIKGNIMITSWRANWLKHDATLEELEKLGIFWGRYSRKLRLAAKE